MVLTIGFALIALVAGCIATPLFEYEDQFYHTGGEITRRIAGGDIAPEGSVPYMVALTEGVDIRCFFCGGSILTERTVLTAAHCIEGMQLEGELASSFRVTVGTNRWHTGGQTLQVQRTITHPHYKPCIIKNDIGLVITATPINFSKVVQPVQISSDFIGAGVKARAAGWGRVKAGGTSSEVLLELYTETIDGDQCVAGMAKQRNMSRIVMVPVTPVEPAIEVCAYHSVNHGMCNGDSGSALVRADNGQQFGIVSWGLPCAVGAPDVFVRVSAYNDWLAQNMV